MNDLVSRISQPITSELEEFNRRFDETLSHSEGSLSTALSYIRQRTGKRMRPMLIFLMAKTFGDVNDVTQRAALGLEMLHTASLVHDDVVDEADERRGQPSVNAVYDNKVAVLLGDYILSTLLICVAGTGRLEIVTYLSRLGQTLSNGEILQLTSNGSEEISEETYFNVIKGKTAALFEAGCVLGAMSTNATEQQLQWAKEFGQKLGTIFQIRDDIFDYFDSEEIGKPTGNDMTEGKLTLPVIHCLLKTQSKEMTDLAYKVKRREANQDEITTLVRFTKDNGGIEYAEQVMQTMRQECMDYIRNVPRSDLREALTAYVEYVIERDR